MVSEGSDELSGNDELREYELSGSDCIAPYASHIICYKPFIIASAKFENEFIETGHLELNQLLKHNNGVESYILRTYELLSK